MQAFTKVAIKFSYILESHVSAGNLENFSPYQIFILINFLGKRKMCWVNLLLGNKKLNNPMAICMD